MAVYHFAFFVSMFCLTIYPATVTDSFLHQGDVKDVLVLYSDVPLPVRIKKRLSYDGIQEISVFMRGTTQELKTNALLRLNKQRPSGYELTMASSMDTVLTLRYPYQTIEFSLEQCKNFHTIPTTIITLRRTRDAIVHKRKKPLVVIDAGHGGEQSGARGLYGLIEKNIVLEIGKKLSDSLYQRGCDVLLTRKRDESVPLDMRTSLANKKRATLFVSLHTNYAFDSQVRGIETLFYHEQSRLLAESVHAQLIKMPVKGIVDRGVKQALVQVVYGCECPSILVELFFLSNSADARLLQDVGVNKRVVQLLSDAIDQFLRLHFFQ